ncbi:uncharacterized protein [Symphalangus syndactylus]|uniref:uncharacterized protein isoform X2 n=1 Tax=Symphalangus syndactylus TaxID=9590 RepID=UPI0030061D57
MFRCVRSFFLLEEPSIHPVLKGVPPRSGRTFVWLLDLDWDYTINFPWSPACRQQIMGLTSLHNQRALTDQCTRDLTKLNFKHL